MKIYKQETNKSCGIACLRSIINNYDNNYSEKDIWDKHESIKNQNGEILNPIINLGVTALKFGFKTTYIGYNPIIINQTKEKDLTKALKEKSKKYFGYGKSIIDESLKFLELNGKLKTEILNIEKLKKLIDKNNHLLIEVKPCFLYNIPNINMNHKIILTGYNNKGFNILDPSDAKKHNIKFDQFLLAFYAAVPEILIINK